MKHNEKPSLRCRLGRVLTVLVAVSVSQVSAAGGSFQLTVDPSQAAEVLQIVRQGASKPQFQKQIEAVSRVPATRAAIEHTAFFDPLGTAAAWQAGLGAAAAGTTLRDDPFHFNELRGAQREAGATIAEIEGRPNEFTAMIQRLIDPYMPAGLVMHAEMRLVAGARATGWTQTGADVFYFNIARGEDDLPGVAAISAHELYHLVLAHILPRPRLSDSAPLGRVERVLLNGVDEGMASLVGRFDPNDTGVLTQRNIAEDRANEARKDGNWALLSALIIATFSSADVTPDHVHRIAFAGAFDEPGYYVFLDMAHEIERQRGRPALLELVRRPPSEFVLAYSEMAAKQPSLPQFDNAALAIVHSLDSAEHAKGATTQ